MTHDVTGISDANTTGAVRSLRACPNPTTGQSAISYSLPRDASVSCAVYDAAGNVVSRLAAGTQSAGEHQLKWNAEGIKAGVYFCKLTADGRSTTARVTRAR